ncbi:MAG: hypothetical protein WDN31_00365 [Hyphomicrobium sp.]
MGALHALGQQGGWPLTMFLDSAARPVWGGYLFSQHDAVWPPGVRRCAEARCGRLSRRAGEGGRQRARTDGSAAAQGPGHLGSGDRRPPAEGPDDPHGAGGRSARTAACRAHRSFRNGASSGCCGAAGIRYDHAPAREAVIRTLDNICQGGIYDHLGGGLCALLGRRAVAGAALREDALRQRPCCSS